MTLTASTFRFIAGPKLSRSPNSVESVFARCLHWIHGLNMVIGTVRWNTLAIGVDLKHQLPALHRIDKFESCIGSLTRPVHLLTITSEASNYLDSITGNHQQLIPMRAQSIHEIRKIFLTFITSNCTSYYVRYSVRINLFLSPYMLNLRKTSGAKRLIKLRCQPFANISNSLHNISSHTERRFELKWHIHNSCTLTIIQ